MEEQAFSARLVKQEPDPARALFALKMASETLMAANELYSRKEYAGAFVNSRDAIRLVSSALMFRDGYISDTFDGAIAHMLERYPGLFPVAEWQQIESFPLESAPGLLNLILRLLGRLKKPGEQEANQALKAASSFVESARAEMVL